MEVVSALCEGTARDLARLAAIFANKGEFEGKRLIQEQTWDLMHSQPDQQAEAYSGQRVSHCLGGNMMSHSPSEFTAEKGVYHHEDFTKRLEDAWMVKGSGWYGWCGFGGSTFQWHPELKIGFAYVATDLYWCDMVNEKASQL